RPGGAAVRGADPRTGVGARRTCRARRALDGHGSFARVRQSAGGLDALRVGPGLGAGRAPAATARPGSPAGAAAVHCRAPLRSGWLRGVAVGGVGGISGPRLTTETSGLVERHLMRLAPMADRGRRLL